jgi:predicted Zn-dependent protease
LVVHQFTDGMIRNRNKLRSFPRVALVLNADGVGTAELKRATYDRVAPARNSPAVAGFKLFYEEDTFLMTPREVLMLKPRPQFVVYE